MPIERNIQPPVNHPEQLEVTEEVQPESLASQQTKVSQIPDSVESPVVDEGTSVTVPADESVDNEWHVLLNKITLGGMAKQLAEHCLLKQFTGEKMVLLLEASGVTLKTRLAEETLQEALSQYFERPLTVEYEVVTDIAETPAQRRFRHDEELQQQAEQSIASDPFVQQLKRDYDAVVLPSSIRPNKVGKQK